jgi:hypothetical protein
MKSADPRQLGRGSAGQSRRPNDTSRRPQSPAETQTSSPGDTPRCETCDAAFSVIPGLAEVSTHDCATGTWSLDPRGVAAVIGAMAPEEAGAALQELHRRWPR